MRTIATLFDASDAVRLAKLLTKGGAPYVIFASGDMTDGDGTAWMPVEVKVQATGGGSWVAYDGAYVVGATCWRFAA